MRKILIILCLLLALTFCACTAPQTDEETQLPNMGNENVILNEGDDPLTEEDVPLENIQDIEITMPFSNEDMIPEWLDVDITYEQLDAEGNYISKEYINEELCDYQIYDMGGYQYTFARDREDSIEGKLVYVDITDTTEDKTGPLGICIGDSYETLTNKYPDTYYRDDLITVGGYVLHVDNEITCVPEGITPFVKVEFENDVVCAIRVILIRLT